MSIAQLWLNEPSRPHTLKYAAGTIEGLQALLADAKQDLFYWFRSFAKPKVGFQYDSISYVDKFDNQLNRRYFLRRFVKLFMAFETVRQIIKNDEYRLQPFPLLFVYDETNN